MTDVEAPTTLVRITSEEDSRSAEEALRSAFADSADFAGDVNVGYQGGGQRARVYWHELESLWACIDEAEPQANRFWNAFGLGDPRAGTPSIVCEVNPPRLGVSRAVAGVFAIDQATGKRFLLHTRRIGGGRAGVGPEAFRKHFNGQWVSLESEAEQFALVAALDAADVVAQVGAFVRAVARVKLLATAEPEAAGEWWVNQGRNYQQERAGGYVRAPKAQNGRSQEYWTNVSRLVPGDKVLHYARKAVRAVGTVVRAPASTQEPWETEVPWEQEGWIAGIEYRDLAVPISLDEIPPEWRAGMGGPFDKNGAVGMGYLYRLPTGFLGKFLERFADRVPNPDEQIADTIVVAAGGSQTAWLSDEAVLREQLDANGSTAMWFSFPLQPEHAAILDHHPWVYIYVGQKTSAIAVRAHVLERVTLPGNDGLVSPWPDATPEQWRGLKSVGAAASQLFKTWFLVDKLETLDAPLVASQFITQAGQTAEGGFLLGGFGIWSRKQTTEPPAPTGCDMDELSKVCHIPVPELEELVAMLREKRQVILEGPPGSGKTFVADLVARFITDNPLFGDHSDRLEVVQFHQSYGYEDFVQGIRPHTSDKGLLEYRLENGIFKRLAVKASADPSRPYVLVVDEINRGNLSRIFGELLLLLEYRGKKVALPYSNEADRFQIPPNLYLIGTMNTTDRSLAQVDYALRRRFYFYRLLPTSGGDAPVLRSWLEANVSNAADRVRVLSLFLALNAKLRAELGVHFQVGHSYFMVKDIGTPVGLERTWRRALEPLLEEYFYNRKDREALLDSFTPAKLTPTPPADEL